MFSDATASAEAGLLGNTVNKQTHAMMTRRKDGSRRVCWAPNLCRISLISTKEGCCVTTNTASPHVSFCTQSSTSSACDVNDSVVQCGKPSFLLLNQKDENIPENLPKYSLVSSETETAVDKRRRLREEFYTNPPPPSSSASQQEMVGLPCSTAKAVTEKCISIQQVVTSSICATTPILTQSVHETTLDMQANLPSNHKRMGADPTAVVLLQTMGFGVKDVISALPRYDNDIFSTATHLTKPTFVAWMPLSVDICSSY